jgi:integrase
MEVRWAREASATGKDANVRLSTGKTCAAADWNEDKERVVGRDLKRGKTNERLGDLEKAANKALGEAEVMGTTLTAADMRALLLAITKPNATPASEPEPEPEDSPADWTLPEVVSRWQQQLRGQRSANYLRVMKAVADYWEKMRKGTTLGELLPDKKTGRSDLVEKWTGYLLEDVPRRGAPGEYGLDNNTVGTYLKRLRTLIQFSGLPYAWLKDELTYEIEIEPLEYEEVLQLAAAEMPRLQVERARDCFVFNCFTGPRYQNLRNLAPTDVRKVQGVHLLEYTQYKGRKKTKVKVALTPQALAIWARYEGKLPVMANQGMNELIKEAAEAAGLTRVISRVRQYSTKQVTERGPISEFITCHLARHTFATLLLDGDASLGEVQDSLGHSSLQSTRRYAKSREKSRHTNTLGAFDRLQQGHDAQSSHSAPKTVRNGSVTGTKQADSTKKPKDKN